jgi:hypothetical protein
MVGLKVSTEENLVKGKEQSIFLFSRKTQEFHLGYITTRYNAIIFCPLTLSNQQRETAPTTVRLTLKHCDLERTLSGEIGSVKKLFG